MRPLSSLLFSSAFFVEMLTPALFLTEAAHAQERAATKPEFVLDTIVVEARRFEETLQDVPFSVTALTEKDIKRGQVTRTADMLGFAPGFNFTYNGMPQTNFLNMRGVGSSSALLSPAVTYYIDGVPTPQRVFDQRFMDPAQIEILRGPQGTLYGLNSQAGVVNIKTEEPGSQLGGQIATEFGSWGHRELSAKFGGPLSEKMSFLLSGHLNNYDGDVRNFTFEPGGKVATSKREMRGQKLGSINGKLIITPDEDTRVTVASHYAHDQQRPLVGVWLDDPKFPRHALNPVPEQTTDTYGGSVTIERDFDWGRFTSISAYEGYNLDVGIDLFDGFMLNAQTGLSPFVFQRSGTNVRQIDEHSSQFTQEIRLDGETEGGVRWVAGLSGLYSDFDASVDFTSTRAPNGLYNTNIKTANVAAFGEVTLPVADRTRLTAGLRLNHEQKNFTGTFSGRSGGARAVPYFGEKGRNTYNFVTGRVSVAHDFTDKFTGFATVSRGYKTGGYPFANQFAAFGIPLKPTKSASTWSYEAGVRGRPFNDRFELGASVFLNDTTNEQLFTFNPLIGRFDVQNANTRTYGAEVEAKWQATDNLRLIGNLSLLHSKITSAANHRIIGNEMPYAPRFTAALAAEYAQPVNFAGVSGNAFARAEYRYAASQQIDPANSRKIDGYGVVNLRAGFKTGAFETYGYVKNVFDETYATAGYVAGKTAAGKTVFGGVTGAPRSFGLGLRYQF